MRWLVAISIAMSMLCGALSAHAQDGVVARVNGSGIASERLERAFEEDLRQRRIEIAEIRHPDRYKELKRKVLDNLIEQELFWQQAQDAKLAATPEEIEQAFAATKSQFGSAEKFERRLRLNGLTLDGFRALLARQLAARKYIDAVIAKAPVVSDEEMHRFYIDNPDKFHRPETLRLRQIVLAVSANASEAERAAVRARIDELWARAQAGENFGDLARQHSTAPTKQWGGEMDPIRRGQLPANVEDAAFALAPGAISEVIPIPGGLQILKLESRDTEVTVSETDARTPIRNYLEELRARRAVAAEVERLREASKIEVFVSL